MLSHYYCELAAQKRYAGEIQVARELLHKSLEQDGDCTRASLMLGELELDSGNVKKAIRALQSVRKQDRDFIPETIDPLRKCYQAKEDDEALRTYLQECLQAAPSPELVLAMAKYIEEADGSAAAAAFLSSQLAERPSLRGLSRLISLQVQTSEGRVHDDLDLLKVLVTRLISERPAYRCEHCGFSGRQLHWFCPGCKRWGTIKPVRAGGAH